LVPATFFLVLLMAACGRPTGDTGAVRDSDLAVLAQAAAGYAEARPGPGPEFPRDHGPHRDYHIEWWYLTANLEDAEGRDYGTQWTLFRVATAPPDHRDSDNDWQDGQLYMAHAAISWPDGHRSFQRYARGGDHSGVAQAGARAEPFAAWLDDWTIASSGAAWLPMQVQARQDAWGFSLRLEGEHPPLLQGEGGFSRKHRAGGGSWYYSQPFLAAAGELLLDGEAVPVSGQAWLDREWSSQFLQNDQVGWDWFALHLDSDEKLMLFRMRGSDPQGNFQHGVLIKPDGQRRLLDPARIEFVVLATEHVAGRSLPLRWRIGLPELDRSLEVEALHPQQWMEVDFPYWEGIVTVRGTGPDSTGRGYLELTGYSPAARPDTTLRSLLEFEF
jgi:predicted secreted hydrolase